MTHKFIPTRDCGAPERRRDGPVEIIDEAVIISSVDGVGPAIDHMSEVGVPHDTALRVLSGPQYHRRPESRTLDKVLALIASRMRRLKQ